MMRFTAPVKPLGPLDARGTARERADRQTTLKAMVRADMLLGSGESANAPLEG